MQDINHQAVRALNKAMQTKMKSGLAEALNAEHRMSSMCGHMCGFHDFEEAVFHDVAEKVGARFGLSAEELEDQQIAADYEFNDHFLGASFQ